MIYLTADTHFSHKLMRRLRGYSELEPTHMNEHMIKVWNQIVSPNDEVYHCGDVSFANPPHTVRILERLNGRIYLVRGNHDGRIGRGKWGEAIAARFEWVRHYHVLKHEKIRAVLSHYPFETWDGAHRGTLHFHGHSHGSGRRTGRRRDVGWDVYKRPVSLDALVYNMQGETYEARDHHRPG